MCTIIAIIISFVKLLLLLLLLLLKSLENSLPVHLRDEDISYNSFQCELKTFWF